MAAFLGPSWSLRSNASPRCLTAYATKTNEGGGGGDSSNPFDDESVGSRSHQHPGGGGGASASGQHVYSVAFGTERGSLHYRQYPPLKSDDGSSNNGRGVGGSGSGGGHHGRDDHHQSRRGGGGYHHHEHRGGSRDPSQLFIDPESAPDGQINLQGAVKGSIVGIVRAEPMEIISSPSPSTTSSSSTTPVFLLLVDDNRGSSSASQSSNPGAYAAHLVTMKRGAFHKLPAAPATDGGVGPDKPPSSGSHHRGGGGSGAPVGGSSSSSSWFGDNSSPGPSTTAAASRGKQLSSSQNNNAASSNNNNNAPSSSPFAANANKQLQSLGAMPRMSCVAHHPAAGFVYAAGTGVHGLPPPAARAVSAGAAAVSENGGGGGGRLHPSGAASSVSGSSHSMRQRHGSHATTTTTNAYSNAATIPPPTAVYLRCNHALPLPGARCSGAASNGNSMTLACAGRVAVVAVANAFYAVPACLDVNALRNYAAGGTEPGGGGSGSGAAGAAYAIASSSSLPSVTATKIAAFAQSSQVHPVIAVEVLPPSPDVGRPASSADVARRLKPIAALLFLASGRECTTLEIASVPDPRAVAMVGNGSGVAGGGMVTTSIKATAPKHGMATLPSPILAAAPLPPAGRGFGNGGGGDLTAGPLVALLTVDGLVHIRSPFCVAVPLASIEVGTRPNDFFALAPLPASPFKYHAAGNGNDAGRNIVATSYGGEARLVSARAETPQDFADRLIKLCIDAFGSNGFPRLELAEALGATFSATSYAGPEPTAHKRNLLKQYLESVLGLGDVGGSGGLRGRSSAGGVRDASGGNAGVSFVMSQEDGQESGLEVEDAGLGENDQTNEEFSAMPSAPSLGANPLLTCTALLCLVCYQLNPPNGTSACRASKVCASNMGIVRPKDSGISKAAMAVCELVADRLLKEVSTSFSLLSGASSSAPNQSSHNRMTNRHNPQAGSASMEFVESAVWLLRSCGCHEKAIDVLQERMNSPAFRNASVGGGQPSGSGGHGGGSSGGSWSQIKFDSYLATHLDELWSSKDDRCCQLVLLSPATKDLIARNPTLGLSVFTTIHPQNAAEWKRLTTNNPADDPLAHPMYPPKVVELLKSISPQEHSQGGNELGMAESFSSFSPRSGKADGPLPINSGRALAVSYLESAIGIATGRPAPASQSNSSGGAAPSFHQHQESSSSPRDEYDERKADMHDELSYLLLEGVISERGDKQHNNDNPNLGPDEDSDLGAAYRFKLRRLLGWPNSKIRSERLLSSLPTSFLREHALLLGRLGRHEDALQILYSQEKSLELALEYCDARHERQMAKRTRMEEKRANGGGGGDDGGFAGALPPNECAYIPLVKVALSSDPDSDRGTAAAIQVLALRRNTIDKAAALRLLPRNIPMSSVVRPFLIPAVVENESQVRKLTVASSLLRSKYVQLKQKLTEAQLQSQATLQSALALRGLNHLGDPIHSSKPAKARPVHAASPYYPDVTLVRHFFPRHLVIQAQVMNSNNATPMTSSVFQPNKINNSRTLADVAFVIAESSDEALVPTVEMPLKTVPPGATGSVWCVLAASPQRLDGAAFLTCELRFTVLEVDSATGTPLNFSDEVSNVNDTGAGFGRTYVEELQDMEVRHSEFG